MSVATANRLKPDSPFKRRDKIDFDKTNFLKPFDPHVRTPFMDEDIKEKIKQSPPKLDKM